MATTQLAPKPATAKRGAKQQSGGTRAVPPENKPENVDSSLQNQPAKTHRLRTSFEPMEFTPLQETAIDLVTDLIVHGGKRGDAYNVFYGALSHYYRRRFEDRSEDRQKFEKSLEDWLDKRLPEWETDIYGARKRNPRREMKDPADDAHAVTASAKARVYARQQLIGQMEDFANTASGEEARLMYDIMTDWDSVNMPSVFGHPEIALAEAFSIQIGEHVEYIRVPTRLIDQVRRFVEALTPIENAPKAA